MNDLRVLARAHLNVVAAERAWRRAKDEQTQIERAILGLTGKGPLTVLIDNQAVTIARAVRDGDVSYVVSELVA